jgi:uncharacterized Zn-binding protein involved in type VI secretion
MRPAARLGDSCIPHCSPMSIMTGATTVLINGRPAARLGDSVTPHLQPARRCRPHTASIISGSATVFIEGRPAARLGDKLLMCTAIASGSFNTFIGG